MESAGARVRTFMVSWDGRGWVCLSPALWGALVLEWEGIAGPVRVGAIGRPVDRLSWRGEELLERVGWEGMRIGVEGL